MCFDVPGGIRKYLRAWAGGLSLIAGLAAAPSLQAAPRDPSFDFSIERAPSWLVPVAPDPASDPPAAPVQVLLVDRQTRLEASGSRHFVHVVRRINESAGLQKGAQIEIEFDPGYQKLVLHRLVLWRGAQPIDKLNRKMVKMLHRETQLERQVVDGRMTASIVLDDLRVGDRVEYSYSLVGENPVFEGRFVDIEWTRSETGPLGLFQFRLLAAPERKIQYRTTGSEITVDSRVHDGWRETIFRRRRAPQFSYDAQLPPREYLKDQIELSEFADWAEVARWAEGLFHQSMHDSPALDERVSAIQAQASTPMARLRGALDFVQKDVRYFGTEMGANSHRPATAEAVLRQRFGDCKDKASLLSALAVRLGLKATPVLVSTQYQDEMRHRLPSPLDFDHVIARVDIDGQVLWLDATRDQQTGTPSTRQSTGLGSGLPASADATDLSSLPGTSDVLRSQAVDTFSFPKLAEEGTLESVVTYEGDLAEWLKSAQAALPPADFEKWLTQEVLHAYPHVVQDGPPRIEPVADRNAQRVTMRYRTGTFWRFPEQRMLMGDFSLWALMSPLRLNDQAPRSQALRIGLPGVYRHTVRFVFGEEVYSQPGSRQFDESNPNFKLHLQYTSQRKEQSIEGELRQADTPIEAAEWTGYRDRLFKIWPRLTSSVSVPAIAPEQFESMRAELKMTGERIAQGKLPASTPVQVNAQIQLVILNRQLAAGRLPGKFLAEAFTAKGVQLDYLGRAAEARPAFERAVDLDKESSEAFTALAANAMLRGQYAEAVTQATRALQLAPSQTAPRYTRAWSRYLNGQPAEARDEFRDLLQSRSEVEHGYGAIWLYLATRRAGGDGQAAVREYMPTAAKPEWPYPVLQLMTGQIDLKAAQAAARENAGSVKEHECELYLYAGLKALLDSDRDKARDLFQDSIATGVKEFNEYAMARQELDHMAAVH